MITTQKYGLTYPPGMKGCDVVTRQRQSRPSHAIVWSDGDFKVPMPANFFKGRIQVNGVGAILFGEKGMIVHAMLNARKMLHYAGKLAKPVFVARTRRGC